MGTFRTDVEVENPASPTTRHTLHNVLVDTGAELSWFPGEILSSLGIERRKVWHFRQADGTTLCRWTGGVSVYVSSTPDRRRRRRQPKARRDAHTPRAPNRPRP